MEQKIDFSKMEKLEVPSGSFEMVMQRIHQEAAIQGSLCCESSSKFSFWASAIPLAASLVFVGLGVLLSIAGGHTDSLGGEVSMNQMASSELSSWYQNLGSDQQNEFENLDYMTSFNYLLKE